jgi:hypothetical protein
VRSVKDVSEMRYEMFSWHSFFLTKISLILGNVTIRKKTNFNIYFIFWGGDTDSDDMEI